MPGPPPVRDSFPEANLEIDDFAAKGKVFLFFTQHVQTHDLRDCLYLLCTSQGFKERENTPDPG
jgi:hypothetical protein